MADQGWIEAQRVYAMAIQAEIEGMKAANQAKIAFEGDCFPGLEYNQRDFDIKAQELYAIYNVLMENR